MELIRNSFKNKELQILEKAYNDLESYFLIHLSSSNGVKDVKWVCNNTEETVNAKQFSELYKKFQFMPHTKDNIKYNNDGTKHYKSRPVTIRLEELFG